MLTDKYIGFLIISGKTFIDIKIWGTIEIMYKNKSVDSNMAFLTLRHGKYKNRNIYDLSLAHKFI